MKNPTKASVFFLLTFLIPINSIAEERKEAWYVTSSGESSVMESLYGGMYATLYEAQNGEPNVYFEAYSPDYCKENGERTIGHDPVRINGTLVQFSQHCRDEWNLFFAPTAEGSNYVINQFKKSRSVTIEYGGETLIFSAMGFIDHYNKINNNLQAL